MTCELPPPVPGTTRPGLRRRSRCRTALALVGSLVVLGVGAAVFVEFKRLGALAAYEQQWRKTPPNLRFDPNVPDRWRQVTVPEKRTLRLPDGTDVDCDTEWEAQYLVQNEGRRWYVNAKGEWRGEEGE